MLFFNFKNFMKKSNVPNMLLGMLLWLKIFPIKLTQLANIVFSRFFTGFGWISVLSCFYLWVGKKGSVSGSILNTLQKILFQNPFFLCSSP